jgi:DNA-directed RNA polymerase subunit RPC12/RpoP
MADVVDDQWRQRELYRCLDCGAEAPWKELPEAEDIFQRMEPGSPYSDKECAQCSALAIPVERFERSRNTPYLPVSDLLTDSQTHEQVIYQCDDCGALGLWDELPEAEDILDRLEPGGPYTDKECAECGALAYPVAALSQT